jgi:hypothetical protein
MSGSFDKPITYLSVINITGDDSNSIGTVLGEIKTDADVEKFNALTDKPAKITSFKDAITKITKSGDTIVEPATTTIIIEGLVSGNQYEFAKINNGDLTNFNSYTLADKKTKVQELISSVLLSNSSSNVDEECKQVEPPIFPESDSEVAKSEVAKSEVAEQAKVLLQIVECLKETNTENNVNISKIITELGSEAGSTSFTASSIERIINYADDEASKEILKKCAGKFITQAKKAIEEGKDKGVSVKQKESNGEKGEGEEVEPSEILGDAIGKTFIVCGQTAAAATVIAALVPFLYYISILPETISDAMGDMLAGSMGTMGGRPKKKTRKRKSRKSRKSRKTKKRKGKGRSRKIKRKHR